MKKTNQPSIKSMLPKLLAVCTALSIISNCSKSSESVLNQVIENYEKHYSECGNQPDKQKAPCFTVYSTLASLYYTREFKPYKEHVQAFDAAHTVKYDSLFFADYNKNGSPKFDKTIKLYREMVDIWGEDKLAFKSLTTFTNALYFSKHYTDALPLIAKILSRKPNIPEKETFEVMRYNCYLNIGQYDTAAVLMKAFISSAKNREYLKFSQVTLNNIDTIKKYVTPGKIDP